MTENNINWQSKIKFFTKFIGYDTNDLEDTLDETTKTQYSKRSNKGIQIMNTSSSIQSMVLPSYYSQQVDKKWVNLLRICYPEQSKSQLLKLTNQGVYYANKVMPWLAQNKQKINLKLFNIKRLQYRTCLNPNNPYVLQKMSQQLQILTIKLGHSTLTELLGIMLLYRQDLKFTETLLAIGQTVNEYLFDAPIIAFTLLYNFCCVGALLPFLINDQEIINYIINQVCVGVRCNCPSSAFLVRDQVPYHQFVRVMIECFWLNISQNRSQFRQKILYFLLINKINIFAISRICEAAINGLSRIINQGNKQKTIQVLNNPRAFLDEQVFLEYLFSQR